MPDRRAFGGFEEKGPGQGPGPMDLRVTFEDGNTVNTRFNGTIKEAEDYYLGKPFNFGDTDAHPKDHIVKAVKIENLGSGTSRVASSALDAASRADRSAPPVQAEVQSLDALASFAAPDVDGALAEAMENTKKAIGNLDFRPLAESLLGYVDALHPLPGAPKDRDPKWVINARAYQLADAFRAGTLRPDEAALTIIQDIVESSGFDERFKIKLASRLGSVIDDHAQVIRDEAAREGRLMGPVDAYLEACERYVLRRAVAIFKGPCEIDEDARWDHEGRC